MAADSATIAMAAFAAIVTRLYLIGTPPHSPHSSAALALLRFFAYLTPVAAAAFVAAGILLGIYGNAPAILISPGYGRFTRTTAAAALAAASTLSGLYLLHLSLVYRGPLLLMWAFAWAGTAGSRRAKELISANFYVEPNNKALRSENDRVLVVGGAGYIGSVLVRQLLDQGYRVRVLDNLTFGNGSVREVLSDRRLELQKADFRNVESVVEATRGMGSVVHLGAIVGDPACSLDAKATISHNFYATKLLVDVAKGMGVRRFVFASTCSVYGAASSERMSETSRTNPVSLYATTKLDSERIVSGSASGSFHPVILRFATAFGLSHRNRFDLVVNLFSAQAIREGRITAINPEQGRPFIHVRDIARSIVACLQAPAAAISGQTFNAGSDRINHTIGEVASIVRELVPSVEVEVKRNNSDMRDYLVRFEKIRAKLGFDCETSLRDGVEELVTALRTMATLDYRGSTYNNYLYLKEYGMQSLEEVVATASDTFLANVRSAGA